MTILLFFSVNLCTDKLWSQSFDEHVKYYTSLLEHADSLYHIGDTLKAISKLEEVIFSNYRTGSYLSRKKIKSDLFYSTGRFISKFDICIILSELSLDLNQYVDALKYLKLANKDYFPGTGCLNGVIMYRTKLSLHYAKYYLKIGDRDKAKECLFKHFISNEAYQLTAAKMLKDMLLSDYSQEQISAEIERGISNMTIAAKIDSNGQNLKLTFFNITISKYYDGGNLDEYRTFYENHPSIKILKNIAD